MTDNAHPVLRAALALPQDERAQVAAALIASLDEGRHDAARVASAWAKELERRAVHALQRPSSEESWDTARDRIADQLSSR